MDRHPGTPKTALMSLRNAFGVTEADQLAVNVRRYLSSSR